MAIDKTKNARFPITIPLELKAKLEAEAAKQNRSASNLAVTIIMQYFESLEKKVHAPFN